MWWRMRGLTRILREDVGIRRMAPACLFMNARDGCYMTRVIVVYDVYKYLIKNARLNAFYKRYCADVL
jgi:hypothetical protein